MKIVLFAAISITLMCSYQGVATAQDSSAKHICEYVTLNDKKRLRAYLKANKIKLRTIFNNIQCNEQNLLEFSASSKAIAIGEFLIGQLPVKIVEQHLVSITKHSPELAQVANNRINK